MAAENGKSRSRTQGAFSSVTPDHDHVAEIRAEEAAVEQVEIEARRLLGVARARFGVDRTDEPAPLRDVLERSHAGFGVVLTFAAIVLVSEMLTTLFDVLGPQIRHTLGLSEGAFGALRAQRGNAAVGLSLGFAALVHCRPYGRRALVLYGVVTAAIGATIAAFAQTFGLMLMAVGMTAPIIGSLWVLYLPMIIDGYPLEARCRIMSLYQGGIVTGAILGAAFIGLLDGPFGVTWRTMLVVLGILTALVAVMVDRVVRIPTPGRHDADEVRDEVRRQLGADVSAQSTIRFGFFEALRRVWLIATVKRLLAAWAVLGAVLLPVFGYASSFIETEWAVGTSGRSAFFAGTWALAVPALAWFGPRGDRAFRRDPSALITLCSRLFIVLAGALLATSIAPDLPVALVAFGVALAMTAVLQAGLSVVTLSIVPPGLRPHAGALIASFLVGVGGTGGSMVLGGLDRRFGAATAVAVLAGPAIAAAVLLRPVARTVNRDLDQLLEQIIEEEEISFRSQRGVALPMVACRHIDFSYGQLQVLFDVNFTVDDGEIVALLGTNGAGKSTLLRVISGLGFPSRGSVRFEGVDVTYIDAERRVGLGVAQIPGGRAVFGPMSVVDNLRVLGHTHGRNRRAVEAGIDASFEAFPRLAERRNQLASTLSGGEQQMLGLATAFVLTPRVLLIDELSLGLAPKVVGELLEMVRRINAEGTAVVLVEQSVNVALSVVSHAYFMEKGAIRFDGEAAELLARPDLLRSVFLEGASKGLRAEDPQLSGRGG